jgi:hypothetical protein
MSDPKYITSNAIDDGIWHLAELHEMRGAVTGKLMRTYWHARCTHRGLGGCYGSTTAHEMPASARLCARCAKLLAKEAAAK